MKAARALVTTAPHLRLLAMPNDQDDPREAATLAPETDREPQAERPSTQPPGPDNDRAKAFMSERLPPDPKLPQVVEPKQQTKQSSSFRQLAESELVVLYRTAIGMHESLLGASGLLEQNRRSTVEDIARVVDRGFDRVWERVEPRLSAQDRKIGLLKEEVGALRDQLTQALGRVDELERRLDEDDAAPGAPALPPG